jgi:hypothetical protein
METVLYIQTPIVPVARRKGEIIPAHLPQFSLAGAGPGKHRLYRLKEAGWIFSCAYRICVLVESHVTGFEKFFEQIAVTERIKTTGPADEDIFA